MMIGEIVLYTLKEYDAEAINRRRADAVTNNAGSQMSGFVAHTGNVAREGQVFPAFVVAEFGGATKNLHVLLDGNDTYWATSRGEGDGPGHWSVK